VANRRAGITSPLVETSEIKRCPNRKIWIVWFALAGASLSKAMLIEGISIGDVFFGWAAVTVLLSFAVRPHFLSIPKWFIYVVFLLILSVVGGLFTSGYSPFAFSGIEFWKSFAKLSFYGIGAILLCSYIRKMDAEVVGKAVLSILTLHALIALYIYLAELLGQISGISLPYEFFWFGQGGPSMPGKSLVPWVIDGIVLNKARGIFSEPANFGIFQTLGLAFLYLRLSANIRSHPWKLNIIFVSLLLTFSLSAYALLFVFLLALLLEQRRIRQLFFLLRTVLGVAVVIFLLFTLTPLRLSNVFEERIIHRFVGFVRGDDRSGTARLIGSWDTAADIVSRSPIWGSGLGNLDVAFNSTGRKLVYVTGPDEQIKLGASIYNIPIYVLGSLGIIGFSVFVLFIGNLVIRAPSASLVFLVSMFAAGTFLESPFWIYYVLLSINFTYVYKKAQDEKN